MLLCCIGEFKRHTWLAFAACSCDRIFWKDNLLKASPKILEFDDQRHISSLRTCSHVLYVSYVSRLARADFSLFVRARSKKSRLASLDTLLTYNNTWLEVRTMSYSLWWPFDKLEMRFRIASTCVAMSFCVCGGWNKGALNFPTLLVEKTKEAWEESSMIHLARPTIPPSREITIVSIETYLLCEILKSGDGRTTCVKIVISGKASWINEHVFVKSICTSFALSWGIGNLKLGCCL